MVSSVKSALKLLPFLTIVQHESGTRRTISQSVTLYNKKISSQCNLTAQIEPLRDKKKTASDLYKKIDISTTYTCTSLTTSWSSASANTFTSCLLMTLLKSEIHVIINKKHLHVNQTCFYYQIQLINYRRFKAHHTCKKQGDLTSPSETMREK